MGAISPHEKKVICDLTSILLKQTFVPLVENLRAAAMDDDEETIELAVKLLNEKKYNKDEKTDG
jgi:hypothetical protein